MRKCPVCKEHTFENYLIEENLPAYECTKCGSIWIPANEYLNWSGSQQEITIDDINIDEVITSPVSDNNDAIICPDCGRFLRRFKIWPDVKFHLDRCGGCNGIWLESNEWQILKAHNLHHKINIFFTYIWQRKLRDEEMKHHFEKIYLDRFGAEDYDKIKQIRNWLAEHPHSNNLLAYLTDKDPYKG